MKRILSPISAVVFGIFVLGSLGSAAPNEEFTWHNQWLDCRGNFLSMRMQMNSLKPFARLAHNYETASAVCNFDTRSADFQCVGYWSMDKEPFPITVKALRTGKGGLIATFRSSRVYNKRPLQLNCQLGTPPKNPSREWLQQ